MQEKEYYINQLSFFSSLQGDMLEALYNISKIIKYPKNSILCYENDKSNRMFFLISGLLKVYKIDKYENEIFLYNVHKNSLVSELTSIENSIECMATSEFMEDGIILEVNFVEFKTQFLDKNILTNEFINEILLKTKQLHSVVNRELVFDASAKVAFTLCDNLEMFNSLKRQEVSFMLHIQPETLSRVLKKLKRSSFINIENSIVTILDVDALQKIYNGEQS